MARPQTDHEATADQLLDCAEQLVRERGPVSITITDIANACGMSQSNVYRFFPNKEALWEAFAERWFHELNEIMEGVVDSDLPPREKLFQFFARRLEVKRSRFMSEPDLFRSYLALGREHEEVVRGYIDLADHYMATILGEAIAEGEFGSMTIAELMGPVNLMVAPFCHPDVMVEYVAYATPENLRLVIDAIFEGLGKAETTASAETPRIKLAS
jgi:AcrR family transcriptional regulator